MSRHVRTLHLTAPTASLAWRGAFLVEDALRTASFAGGQRLVLIRRLDVGKIDPRRPPATVALALERAWQSVAAQWVYAESPAAETAPIVWFQDAVEPYVLFAQQIAQGKKPTAWFWRKAIPAEVMEDPAPLRRLLFTLMERQGLLAVAAFIGELHQRKVLLPLLAQLRPADGELLWSFYPPSPPSHNSPLPFLNTQYAILPPIPAIWDATDPRPFWLVATLLIYEKPARLATPYLRPMAEAIVARAVMVLANAGRRTQNAERNDTFPTLVERPALTNVPDGELLDTQRPASRVLLDLPSAESPIDGVYSEYAGLFLLINVLDRVGMGVWCVAMPELIEGDFPTRVLRHLAGLTLPPTPPLRSGDGGTTTHPLTSSQEGELFDALLPPLHDGEGGWKGEVLLSPFSFLLSLWTILVRRWLARHLRYDLATLVCRPGRVVWTRTHVDVIFDERQVDLAVRLAGVDIDPGWVPWWGRVVKFHYEAMGNAPTPVL
jgi:hypothetical protein